ncbi:hypothetical protein CMV_007252 [Castanea mollissima]|uniref:Endonuclease/exonuclease/phosphatase domain-containing protein n=1 Tax=Castanea mollissima TaxID=60419 RepID=A0A8J4RNF2_9ROSI|nr:hypothetical protein CMV_007252 [Castanea mollissima]
MERLDKAFASVEWINKYPLHSIKNLPIIRSDHGPILLDLEHQSPLRRRPFIFEYMWITHTDCKGMVRKAWDFHTQGSRAEQLKNRLSNVRRVALDWNRNVFGRAETEIWRKQNQLQQIQNSINTLEDIRRERVAREELEELLNREEL